MLTVQVHFSSFICSLCRFIFLTLSPSPQCAGLIFQLYILIVQVCFSFFPTLYAHCTDLVGLLYTITVQAYFSFFICSRCSFIFPTLYAHCADLVLLLYTLTVKV